MAINVNNAEADALTREFATMAGVSITDAIVIAMKEAIERRTSKPGRDCSPAQEEAWHFPDTLLPQAAFP